MSQSIESLEDRRLFAFGAVDAGFGNAGRVTAEFIDLSNSGSREITARPDGSIVYGGGRGLARFLASGELDTKFGDVGIVKFADGDYVDHAVDASGRIYALFGGGGGSVRRYTAAGTLDGTFGVAGAAGVNDQIGIDPSQIALQPDGKIVVAGTGPDGTGDRVTKVVRLAAGGGADTGFGAGGSVTLSFGRPDAIHGVFTDKLLDLRVLPGGQIELLGGSTRYRSDEFDTDGGAYNPSEVGPSYASLARLTTSGEPDSAFAAGGVARRTLAGDEEIAVDAGAIRADGSAVVAATAPAGNGAIYTSFAANGAATTYVAPPHLNVASAFDAAAMADGRVAFVSGGNSSRLWTFDGTGVSNVVAPTVLMTNVAATADGDLIVRQNSADATARLTQIDAGNAGDPRPDEFAATGAVDTATDTFGNLHVAYFDAATKTLRYAYRNARGLWSGVRTVDATSGAGANLSLSVQVKSGKLRVAIAYYVASSADLRLAVSDDLRRFRYSDVATRKTVGISPSLLFTSGGGFAISYHNKSQNLLQYALFDGTRWNYETVAAGGASNELQFHPDTLRPNIAYSGPEAASVRFAERVGKDGWSFSLVDNRPAAVAAVNLLLPNNARSGGPVIGYTDWANGNLFLARYDRTAARGDRWSSRELGSGRVHAANLEMLNGFGNTVTLYAWSREEDSIVRYGPGTTGEYPASEAVVGGGRVLSVARTVDGNDELAYLDTATGKLFVR
ncbi:MAG TPA: delta-60 repeat domain-containing protein [Tepidisphaeraceae bacterium]|jgi:uncharacterized delta-60 repeat protein